MPLGENILPSEGEAFLWKDFFNPSEAADYFDALLESTAWENDRVILFGKPMTMSRKTAWYGTKPFDYTYSHINRVALPFTETLKEILLKVETTTDFSFNSALLNLYHHGMEGMGKHSDDEESIVAGSAIASLSFGAGRPFVFQHKNTREKIKLFLEPGSLLLMKGLCQQCWWHELPKTKRTSSPRINITFRVMRQTD
jgi:alkylated DNA repair dioxygenase AlkB